MERKLTTTERPSFSAIITVFFLLVLLLVSIDAKSATSITGLDTAYCMSDDPDTLYAVNPAGKIFSGPGIIQISIDPAIAIFDPGLAGPGTHIIQYFTETWEVTVSDPTLPTLDPYPSICESEPSFLLSGGSPAGGIYTVSGTDAASFSPAFYGPGTFYITYRLPGCNLVSAPQALTVKATPNVVFNSIPDVCIDTPPFDLDQGLPIGGTYSGPGVTSNIFDPVAAGIGTHTLSYTYSDGSCSNTAYQTITVVALPVVSFSGMDTLYCDTDPPVLITGSPASAGGVFTGNGITDNGNGTATFNPGTTGLGYHQITYTYTNSAGCSTSYTKQVRVGTLLTFSGIGGKYCSNDADVTFTYDPSGGTFTPVSGLTDNGDGTAVLSPSTGTSGARTILYTYTDIYGCVNKLQHTLQVSKIPEANFIGLDPAGYCKNGDSILISGSHAPLGTFSGPGISDNGNGTAYFNPKTLPVGGSYQVDYTYTETATGCGNTASKTTTVLPLPEALISGNQSICYGGSANLSVDFTGTGPFSFTYSDSISSTTINGVADPYTLAVSPTETTSYTIESVSQANGCSNTGTGKVNVSVNPLSKILTNPSDKVICPGQNISFAVTASGVGLNYQWKKDGVNIPGANLSVFTLNNAQPLDAGSYSCMVSSSCGPAITSSAAVLTVRPKTVITNQPAGLTECEGQNVGFHVQASGSALSYQWRKNGNPLTDGGNISGSTSDNLSIDGITPGDAGIYSCVITGTCGNLITDPAGLTVEESIVISTQPLSKSVCPGNNTSFSVIASGSGLTYQWQHDGTDIPGATNPTFVIAGADAADAGNYRCVITGSCGTLASDAASLTVNEEISISLQPASTVTCEGNTIELNVNASGSGLNYQWRKDGTNLANGGNISGANSPALNLSNLVAADAGAYTCLITGSCASSTSSTANVSVDTQINILTNPADQGACSGDNIILNSAAGGSNLTYQWYHDGSPLPGETSSSLVISSMDPADEGEYFNMILNACGATSTNFATLTLNDPVTITSQPSDVVLCEGENSNFTVAATGSNLSYQWLRNGVALSDAGSFSGTQSPSLLINNVNAGDAGIISCIISGDCGTLTTDPATLAVNEHVIINKQPLNKTVCPGTNVNYEVDVEGTGLSYQWQKDGVNIAGKTTDVLSLTGVTDSDEGSYRCVVTGACGTVTSGAASLSVNDQINILSHPSNEKLCEGNNVSFTVSAEGTNLSYQWRKNGTDLSDDGHINGSLTATLTINDIEIADQAVYSCHISSTCGNMNSLPASLTVYPETEITTQPVVFEAVENGSAGFSVSAEGHNLSYQWYKDGTILSNDAVCSGVNSSILTLTNVSSADAGSYYCIVTGSCGSETSDPGVLVVNLLTLISSHPSGPLTKCEDESANFDVVASGTNLSYQWKKDGVDLTDDGRITGSTSASLNINNVVKADEGSYSCLVTGDEGVENSFPAKLNVHELTDITLQPINGNKCEGDDASFTVNASGTITSYQWEKDGISLSDNARINGSATASLFISNLVSPDSGIYACVVSGVCANDVSNPAVLEVYPNTSITSQPVSKTKCAGTSATFMVNAQGGNLTYQWKKNGVNLTNGGNISGANSAELVIANLTPANAGSYSCAVSGNCGVENSNTAVLSVNPETVINIQPADKVRCEGDDVFFNTDASGANLTFEWRKDGVALSDNARINGSSTANLFINDLLPADAGSYQVYVTGDCGSYISDPASLVIHEDIQILSQPADDIKCNGESITFSVSSANGSDSYQWKKNGIDLSDGGDISGVTTANLSISNLEVSDGGVYSCMVSGSCNSMNSDLATLTVKENIIISTQPLSKTVCPGENTSFSVSASGTNLSYQWQQDGTDLPGETNALLSINNVTSGNGGSYRCIISGDCGNLVSDAAVLTVHDEVTITGQPTGITSCEGSTIELNVSASGTGLNYQWKRNGTSLSDGGSISGANSSSLKINGINISDAGAYTCTIWGSCGLETSASAVVVVDENINITQHPVSRNVCAGENVILNSAATGSNILYQWYKDGAALAGQNSAALVLSGVTAADMGSYYNVLSNSCGNNATGTAAISLNDPTVINTHPADVIACEGENASFSVSASGSDLHYQWLLNGIPLSDGGSFTATNSPTLLVNNLTIADAGVITCEISGACGTLTSDPADFIVKENVLIQKQPQNKITCPSTSVSFETAATGTNLSYQWQKDGSNLAGETGNTLTLSAVTDADEGMYRCIITGDCGMVTTNAASLSVNDAINITSQPVDKVLCEGDNASFTVSATGTALSYQWRKNGIDLTDDGHITGSSTNNLSINNIDLSDQAVYSCHISSTCGTANSQPATLTVHPQTVITTQPVVFEAAENGNASFSVTASGHNLTYQWYRNGSPLSNDAIYSGVNTSILSLSDITSSHAGSYHCVVTGTCGMEASDPGLLIVNLLTLITSHPSGPVTKCVDESVSFDVVASGTNLTYQWKKDGTDLSDDGRITGSNSPSLTIDYVVPGDEGSYSCLVNGEEGAENSMPASLNVNELTDITLQPQNGSKCEGDDAVFTISATGNGNSFQWKKDGMNLTDDGRISGSNTAVLSIANLSLADNGIYTCVVTGLCSNDVSNPAGLTVSKNTSITTQPLPAAKCAGTSVTFSLEAEGGNLDYQWKKDGVNLSNSGNVTGTDSPELTIANATSSNAGVYSCLVSGTCGVENSASAALEVNPETVISSQPTGKTSCEGDDAFFQVTAEGSGLNYEWRKDGAALSDDAHISGSSSATLFLNDLVASDEGTYEVYITGTCGNFVSDPADLNMNEKVNILTQPTGGTKCEGESITLSLISGNPEDSYQWKKNGVAISDGGHYSGTTTAYLSISDMDLSDAGVYSCLVSSNCNSINSDLATVSVLPATQINIQPISQNVNEGNSVSFTVSAEGDNLTYQWMKDGAVLSDNATTTGSSTNVITIAPAAEADEGSYTVVVSGTCDNSISDPAILTVNTSTLIISQPSDQILCEGQPAVFSVQATGSDFTYQWKKNGMALTDVAGKISGAHTQNLSISSAGTADEGVYTCEINGENSIISSNTALLVVNPSTELSSQPVAAKVKCAGEDTYFMVNATGHNLTYSWEKDGIALTNGGNITGASGNILTVNSVSSSDAGIYRCWISGSCGTLSTEPSTLSVNELPAAPGVVLGDDLVCQGEKAKAYEIPSVSNTETYEWTLPYGVNIISGAGSRYIVVDYADDAISGDISVHGKNSCGLGPESAALAITVNAVPEANAGFDQDVCSNATTLEGNSTSNGTWTRISGFANFADPNLHNTSVSKLAKGENTLVWTVTENACTSRDTVVITNNLVDVEAGEDQVICDMTASLSASPAVTGNGQWSISSGGANFVNFNDPETDIINIQRGANVLKWSVNNNGCISSDTVTITNDLPSNAFAGADTIILSDTYTLQGNIPSTGTGHWSLVSGVGTIQDPADESSLVSNLGIGANILKWTITNNLCFSEDEVRIINYTPTINNAGPDQTLCEDQTDLMATVPNYGTGLWTIVQGSGSFANASKYDTKVYNLGKGENIFRWTINEYEITHDDVKIINNSPSTANAGIDQNLCADTTILAGNDPVVGTGEWTIAGGAADIDNPSLPNTGIHHLNYGSNTFRWTVTNGSCSSSDEVRIINNLPTPATAGVDQSTCADSVTLFPNTPSIGTGEWSVIKGSGYFVKNKAYNIGIDENLFKWTISNNGCQSSDTVKITSHKPTTAYTIPNKSICYDSLLLPGNTPLNGTGTWSILSGSAEIEDLNDPTSMARNLALGQNKFRWTISYEECSSFSDVTVNYDMINANAGLDQTICNTDAILTANTPSPGTGLWTIVGGSGSADFSNPDQANTQVSNLDRGANVLRWTITNNGCTSYDEVTITNNNPSVAYAGADRSVCGESFFLNANAPHIGTGQWSVLSGSASIEDPGSSNSEVTNLSLGKNTLRWTVTHEGCTSTDEVIIFNDQPTNVSAGTDQYICSDSTQLYSSEAVGGFGRWSIAGGSASFDENSAFNTKVYNLDKGENKLVWTVTISGCSTSDTVLITNNLPSLPSAGPDQDNCASDAYMAANVPRIGTGKWSVVSGSAMFEDPGDPMTKVTAVGNGTNLLRWTISNSSCNLSDDVNVINSLPTLAYAGEDRAVCNTTANLLANPPTTGTGTWKVVSGYGVIENPNDYNTQINQLGFGANTIRWTTENGRCKTSDDVIITSNLAEVNAGEDEIVYSPDITLVGNKPARGSGEWRLVAGSGNITSPDNFETSVTSLGEGANTFFWTIINDGCEASDDVIINYYVLPEVDFVPSPQQGCPPLTVDFINGSVGGNPFTWDFGDGTTSSETNPMHTFTVPGKYTVRLTGTGPDGIMISKDTVVIVSEQPDAEMEITPSLVYVSDPPDEKDEPVHFFTLTANADSVIWDFGDGTFSNERNPIHHYQETGIYDVNLQVITGEHCYDSESALAAVTVERKGSIHCPNAFTPNPEGAMGGTVVGNDYSNDVFHCYGTGLLEYHLEIYNRLGIKMFESFDVNIGWDGYFQGKLAEEGVYVYQVSGRFNNGEKFNEIGNVVLIHP